MTGKRGSKQGRRRNLRFLSRGLFALVIAALIALVVRLRGSGGSPPRSGGWRELFTGDLGPGDGGQDG
ncbi:MAG TPA: hypothetical protein VL984_13620 [Acidimicrobiales bacterium]|nr:hypothetical protein [Acidimicrobiales bacterium]